MLSRTPILAIAISFVSCGTHKKPKSNDEASQTEVASDPPQIQLPEALSGCTNPQETTFDGESKNIALLDQFIANPPTGQTKPSNLSWKISKDETGYRLKLQDHNYFIDYVLPMGWVITETKGNDGYYGTLTIFSLKATSVSGDNKCSGTGFGFYTMHNYKHEEFSFIKPD